MVEEDGVSRREFLNQSKEGLSKLLGLVALAELSQLTMPQANASQSNTPNYQNFVDALSNQDEFVYRFMGKNGKESVFYSIYKYPDRANLSLSRKKSTGFFKAINYGVRLTDKLETGWGNLDRATLTFKDGSDRSKKESSEASFELSGLPKNDELVQDMQQVYSIIGHSYLTRKRSLFNEDVNIIDRLFTKIFEDYRISPPPLMSEHRIPSPKDFKSQKQEIAEDKKESNKYDGKTLIYQAIQTGTKTGIPRK